MKIHEQITEQNWCRFSLSDKSGRLCLYGWINRVYTVKEECEYVKSRLRAYLGSLGHHFGIMMWNDSKATTFQDVKELCVELDV